MIIEVFSQDYAEIVNQWWYYHGYKTVPMEAYPRNTFICFDNKDGRKPILLGSMYLTDTPLVYLDNLVSNPTSNKAQRSEAMKLLFDVFVLRAKAEDKQWWAAHSKLSSLGEIAKQFKQTMTEDAHQWFAGEV